jgi:hypothetical protein
MTNAASSLNCVACGHTEAVHTAEIIADGKPGAGGYCSWRRDSPTDDCHCPGFQPPFYDLSGKNIDAILDTNAFIETATLLDLNRAVTDGSDKNTRLFRWARRRDALLLSIILDHQKIQTFGLHEAHRKLGDLIEPQDAGVDPDHDFLVFHLHVVKDRVLTGWEHHVPMPPETVDGTRVDNVLVATAQHNALPLITTEGLTADGIVDRGMRKKAKKAGVPVFTPGEFIAGRCDAAKLAGTFMERLAKERPAEAVRRREKFGDGDNGDKLFQMVQDAYRALLYGKPG